MYSGRDNRQEISENLVYNPTIFPAGLAWD